MEYKRIVEEVCIVLEKEKNPSNIVFTNMTDLARKVKMDSTPKDMAYIVSKLEAEGLIKTLKKTSRQTVLEIKDNLLCKDIDLVYEKERDIENVKVMIAITPKRLLEYIKTNVNDNSTLNMSSKDLCDEFKCKFDKVKLVLDALQRMEKIEYTFSAGMFFINLIENNKESACTCEQLDKSLELTFDSGDMDVDSIFNEIGEAMQEFFDDYRNLKNEVKELSKKLEIATIANERLRKELHISEMHCKQMESRNNRLYNDIVSLRTGIR